MSSSVLGLSPAAPEYRPLHGTIGQPLSQPLSPYSPSHDLHTPSSPGDYHSYGTSQPRTPVTGNTANVELEVSDLLARATKQAADKKATNTAATGEAHLSSYMKAMEALKLEQGQAYSPVRTSALSPAIVSTSVPAPTLAFGPGVIGQGLASAPLRSTMEDIWADPAHSTGRAGKDQPAPIGTRSAFAPFDSSLLGSTYAKTHPGHIGADVADAVREHLNALNKLLGGVSGNGDEYDRLRKEVEALRTANTKMECEKAGLQELLDQHDNRVRAIALAN